LSSSPGAHNPDRSAPARDEKQPAVALGAFCLIANGVTTTSLPLLPIRVSMRKRMSSAMQPGAERSRVQPDDRRDPDVAKAIA
jgi:hypothetical protein